jgi:hypothetical protein
MVGVIPGEAAEKSCQVLGEFVDWISVTEIALAQGHLRRYRFILSAYFYRNINFRNLRFLL